MAACRSSGTPAAGDPFLAPAWEAYKLAYIHSDGYVLDRTRGSGEVTSEGQGYALLRAVWMRDEACFTRVWNWTEARLRRPDGLFSWRWSAQGGGRVLDQNTATDADQEIAFALIMASVVFDRPELRTRARALLAAIRTVTAIPLPSGWFPAAGNWAVDQRLINLSYFLPYAYDYFRRVDPGGGWDDVSRVGYDLLNTTMQTPGVQLPPDFASLHADGSVVLEPDKSLRGEFSSDGMRIAWRIAFDCQLHERLRACADPLPVSRVTGLLARDGALYTRYTTAAEPVERIESYSFYGAVLPYLGLFAPSAADAVRAHKLNAGALEALMVGDQRYYDANWVWFGVAAGRFLVDRTPRLSAVPIP